MLFNYNYPEPDGSVYFNDMPVIYRLECAKMYIVGEADLLGNAPKIQMTGDVGWIMQFGGYKLKVDQRSDGFHLAGVK